MDEVNLSNTDTAGSTSNANPCMDQLGPLQQQFQTAIEHCKREVLGDHCGKAERFVEGWPILSINQYNHEQERILILTDSALIRVKYNFDKSEIVHAERVALTTMSKIEHGWLTPAETTVQGSRVTTDMLNIATPHYGFRVWEAVGSKGGKPGYRTYRPYMLEGLPGNPTAPHLRAAARVEKQELESKLTKVILKVLLDGCQDAGSSCTEAVETDLQRSVDWTFGIYNGAFIGKRRFW